jgi:hypothetical protein
MRGKLRLTVTVVTVTGLLFVPGPRAEAQENPSPGDIAAFKEALRTPVSGGEPAGSAPSGSAASALPAPLSGGGHQGRSNVQVSEDQDPAANLRSGASELTLAATSDGRRMVAGWNDGIGFAFAPFVAGQPPLGLSGYGFSSDGGRSWTDGGAPPIGDTVAFGPGPQGRSATGNYVTRGDPWLDEDGRGNFFYANLAVWEDDAASPPAGVSIHRGSFRGRSFSFGDPVLVQSPNYPDDFLDKEALAVDRIGNRTALYVSVTNFEEVCDIPFFGFGAIEMYRSLDGGTTWARTVIQPDETTVTDPADPDCGLDGVVNQGSAPAVGPNGEVYVAWERGEGAPDVGGAVLPRATIAFAASTDRGATFTAPREVASICSGANDEPAAYNRTSSNDFPRIAVAQSGRHKGRIYITYHDCRAASGTAPFGADTDVYVTFSDNRGATWSTPRPVHPTADGRQQFWPVVSVGDDGEVDVTYYQMQDVNVTPDPDDIECSVRTGGTLTEPVLKQSTVTTFSDMFTARSTDGGRTWRRPTRLTDVTTNWCAATPINSIIPNFGDYNGSLSRNDDVVATWADGRNAGIVDRVPTAFFGRR